MWTVQEGDDGHIEFVEFPKDVVKDLEAWKASKDVRIKVEAHNLSRCCDTVTWPLGRVSLLSPLGRF